MNGSEFSMVRRALGKTQSELARLLCVSGKAIQSFEQGWRNVPVSVERQLLFLLALKMSANGDVPRCWEIKNCPVERRENCPAWEFKAGHFCWFINGTLCHGELQASWDSKIKLCRQCEVYHSIFHNIVV
ncbi:MAG TPA: helix-turn-helix transcriptional regulator [Dehalococcoidia bacterium]|nr:helix-turn-helix transcriptional regulator [Dehalococcoidia bacterium]